MRQHMKGSADCEKIGMQNGKRITANKEFVLNHSNAV